MFAVQKNPFRVIGVLSNAKEKEIHRQKVKLSKYASVGKNIPSEHDYTFLTPIVRTEQSVSAAFSSIDQRQDKLEYSLFWFVNNNQFDEIALSHLAESDTDKAMSTWSKVTENRAVTANNISSLNNLSTLQLTSVLASEHKSGIANKLKLIQSDEFTAFVTAVTDETFVVEKRQIAEKFIKHVIKLLRTANKTENDVVSYFSQCEQWVTDYVALSFCENLIFDVERAIETTQKKREQSGSEAYAFALSLHNNVDGAITKISNLLSPSSIKFKTISDAVAKEIMQCDIDYFNANNQLRDIFDESLELLGYAKKLSTSDKTRREIIQNIEDMKQRKENRRLGKYYDDIYEELANFKDRFASVENARALINVCKPKLANLRSEGGATKEFIELSSLVVTVALNMMIAQVNYVQNGKHTSAAIREVFQQAVNAMTDLYDFAMNEAVCERYNTNHDTIRNLNKQAERNQGCYIATMAYGDYDHPQVLRLRQFRDQTLAKTKLGCTFIKVYYRYSPLMVEKLKTHKNINKLIKTVLDKLIKILDIK
ncbi:hypothetical protein MSG37_02650 [Shewanella sp. 1CM18E]|uniref:CFI-box-CTERM domain-containing protein n=1 Tax=Shewanella sp. 1CM18E TaxID=2929169 RepID=UPI0020BDB619|nr:CFI-box-CTERM domain-containing protein [Shewanella sp. 1CM18E]MCK8043771.1 hypothetical protein [Shewanella sp. 1CM18E]